MRKLILVFAVAACTGTSALAIPVTLEFVNTTGAWQINQPGDPIDTVVFKQDIIVNKGLGSTSDAVVGAFVHLPDMAIGGIPGGSYTLGGGILKITDSSIPGAETVVFLEGTVGSGDLVPVGTTSLGYTVFQADVSNVTINNPIGSAALGMLSSNQADFQIALTGANEGFQNALDNRLGVRAGFSGAITAPEPVTLVLLGLGGLLLSRRP